MTGSCVWAAEVGCGRGWGFRLDAFANIGDVTLEDVKAELHARMCVCLFWPRNVPPTYVNMPS